MPVGSQVTVEFITGDCDAIGQGHSGYVYLDNFCLSCKECNEWCCPGKHDSNLIHYGDFEFPAGVVAADEFQTQFTLVDEGDITPNAIGPGFGALATHDEAYLNCPKWDADDHYHCQGCDSPQKIHFWTVNGKTCQTCASCRHESNVWSQIFDLPHRKGGDIVDNYLFCMHAKNFPACCFNKPLRVRVQFLRQVGHWVARWIHGHWVWQYQLDWTVVDNIPLTTVATTADPCDWQAISKNLSLMSGQPFQIKIFLDESTCGDGNDLALDDISFQLCQQGPPHPDQPQPVPEERGSVNSGGCSCGK